jgi:hypothetical protein
VLFERTLSEWLRIHTGHIGIKIVKEPCGSIQKVPSGYFGGHFSKEPTTYLLGNDRANCFRAHKELTMDPLGKFPLAPSVWGGPSVVSGSIDVTVCVYPFSMLLISS